ncbi:MAG: ABC transporter substrate-binding protein [Gordonia sp. (in: high G+C Gram-positive bacteria)]|uniref:ABC transporter substrate-binding protein n=1 Tax=Gordonia sp. (in: high G+C Gram-positive bacteria) TaxID=84139 RepID=UPI0039E37CD5
MRDYSPARSARFTRGAAVVGVFGVLVAATSACTDDDEQLRTPDGSVISTVTSRVASVNVVNADRDYADTCLAPTDTDAGQTAVTSVVVTDPALLDPMCALGAGTAVKAVAADAGTIPAYLGPQLTAVPTIGKQPSTDDVRKARPQVVLATPATADAVSALRGSGALGDAKVVTVDTGPDWRKTFTDVAAGLHRTESAQTRLGEFDTEAKRVGTVMDAAHSQVSLIRFTADQTLMAGTGGFAAGILSRIGVQRPAAQRSENDTPLTDQNFDDADADLIYASHEGDAGLKRAESTFDSTRWKDLGAVSWQRILWVDDDVWYHSSGLAAAWLVLNDVKTSLNSSSSSE